MLTYFGYLYPSKGLETLLRAFQLVRSRGRNARLVIAGGVAAHLYEERESYLKELEGLAAALGIEAEHCLDRVPPMGQRRRVALLARRRRVCGAL